MSQQEQLQELKRQIDHICMQFQLIRGEAKDILNNSNMPDATLQLNDVLKHTEEATSTIIESVNGIGIIMCDAKMPDSNKSQVYDLVNRVLEACSFQDISGQRIKKVLTHITDLETQLLRLSDTAKGKVVEKPAKDKDPLLNGPQLSTVAPSQQDIDQLFKTS